MYSQVGSQCLFSGLFYVETDIALNKTFLYMRNYWNSFFMLHKPMHNLLTAQGYFSRGARGCFSRGEFVFFDIRYMSV